MIDLGENKFNKLNCGDMWFSVPDVLVYLYDNNIRQITECTFHYTYIPYIIDISSNQLQTFQRRVFEVRIVPD